VQWYELDQNFLNEKKKTLLFFFLAEKKNV
jgi:hypothetical protein